VKREWDGDPDKRRLHWKGQAEGGTTLDGFKERNGTHQLRNWGRDKNSSAAREEKRGKIFEIVRDKEF